MTVKICHVTSAHSTDDVRILKKECTSLAEDNKYNVFLVGRGKSWGYKNVKIVGVGDPPDNRLERMTKFAKKVVDSAIKLDADIYHLHDPELLRHVAKFKRFGKKVIFDSHENILDSIDDKTYMPLLVRKIFKLYYKYLQRSVLRKVDGIVVVTPQMIDNYTIYNDNVFLIPNYPILSNKFFKQNDKIKKGRLIFAGGISEQWSHREIINAINRIDGVEYYIFGVADDNYLNELKKLDGWKKVYFGGKISHEEVQKELNNAQFALALLKPSKNTFYTEGTLGNTKIFEAMENGIPLIATNFKLWKPIVEDGNCGVCVDPSDEKLIEESIRKAISFKEEKYNKMRLNCKKTVMDVYNWEKAKKELIDLYKCLT